MANLRMIGTVGRYGVDGDTGKILRVLRYKNVADAVEARYSWIPKGTLLAMMAQESGGADMLPNGNDDGGFCNIHMQGETAAEFGLKTYQQCTKMVCKKHGRALRKIIDQSGGNKKEIVALDDRFNPILNLDAVGRMLTYHRCNTQIPKLNPFQTAICRYSGKYNYRAYFAGVAKYRKLLDDQSYLKKIESSFNRLNANLKIDGKSADFKKYMAACQSQNDNYGLGSYQKLGEFKF